MPAIGEILIFLDYLSAVPDVYFNDTKIFLWIFLDNFSAVPDVSADGYDVLTSLKIHQGSAQSFTNSAKSSHI